MHDRVELVRYAIRRGLIEPSPAISSRRAATWSLIYVVQALL